MSKKKCTDKVETIQKMLGEFVEAANYESKFSQRDTELNAVRYVQVLVLGWLKKGEASLNDLAAMAQELGINVTGAAIHARLNTNAVELLRQVLSQALHELPTSQRMPLSRLEMFTAVCITDSTQVRLPDSLYALFAGTNGVAQVKLQVTVACLRGHG